MSVHCLGPVVKYVKFTSVFTYLCMYIRLKQLTNRNIECYVSRGSVEALFR